MRPIKFRAWDKEYEVMTDWFWLSSKGDLYETPATVYDTPHREIERNDDLIVMQYTGLKDKNGVEIYEGDVVKWSRLCIDFNLENYEERSDNFVVEWDVYNTGFVLGDGEVFLYKDISSELEVIGNVYENPEPFGASQIGDLIDH